MKNLVLRKPKTTILIMIFGLLGIGSVGALIALIGSGLTITMIPFLGFLTIVSMFCIFVPVVHLRESMDNHERNSEYYRSMVGVIDSNQSSHWNKELDISDDLDEDGNGNDSLRRLGLFI